MPYGIWRLFKHGITLLVHSEEENIRQQHHLDMVQQEIEHLHSLDNEYKKLYVWNHDMANHLLALSLLAEQEKYDQALSYMKQMQEKEIETLRTQILEKQRYIHSHIDLAIDLCESENYDDMTTLISSLSSHVKRNYPDSYCKNALLNILLQEKKAIADQLNVKCEFRILLPDHFDQTFSDFTITSIFSNLLDNALESCKNCHNLYPQNDPLFIELSTNFKANMFMIRMKNSKNPKDIFLNKTTKDDSSSLHGHGLSIIESIARDYDGTCQWSDDGDCFVSLIMLKHT